MSLAPYPVLQGRVTAEVLLIYDFAYMSTNYPGNRESPSRLRLYIAYPSHGGPPEPKCRFSSPHVDQDTGLHGTWKIEVPECISTPTTPLIMFSASFHCTGEVRLMKSHLFRLVRYTNNTFVRLTEAPSMFHAILTPWVPEV